MLFRHGLRVSELCHIKLDQVHLEQSKIFIKRVKNGIDGMHPMAGDEFRLLRRYLRERQLTFPNLFISERRIPLIRNTVNSLLKQCSRQVNLPPTNPHILRHGCGFCMINNGYDIRTIQHTKIIPPLPIPQLMLNLMKRSLSACGSNLSVSQYLLRCM